MHAQTTIDTGEQESGAITQSSMKGVFLMHARATQMQFNPGAADEAIDTIRDVILASAKKQKGFKGALLLRDVDSSRSFIITLWDTVDDLMESSPPDTIQTDLDRLEELTKGTPTQEIYEVLLRL